MQRPEANRLLSASLRRLRILVGLCLASHLAAQTGEVYKGFKLLDYYKPSNKLKSQITGATAEVQGNGLVLVKKVRIQDYLEDGTTNLTATARECIVDPKSGSAYSPAQLEVETARGQLTLQGRGFFYERTNFNLTLSNQVETTIYRGLLHSSNSAAPPLPIRLGTNALAGSNAPVKVFSDSFFLESVSNLAFYSGSVRVQDPQIELTCQTLTLRRSTNGQLESILADQNVAITNKLEESKATGDHAIYSLEPDKELVILTGREAHWQDREREAKAGTFTFDRRENTLRAEQKPWLKLPRSAISQPEWLTGRPPVSAAGLTLTNQTVEITAEELIGQLPTTNQPLRRFLARTNVVLLIPAEKTQASSDEAFYDEASGVAQISGHAVWQSDERLVKGDTLRFERTNNSMKAQGNAFLRAPLSVIGRAKPAAFDPREPSEQPEMLEVSSADLAYESSALTFRDHVRGTLFQGPARMGWLTCDSLKVGFISNRLDTIRASGSVAIDQPWTGTNEARRTDKTLNCENLTVHFSTNGFVRTILAETNVLARQIEARQGRAEPVRTELAAGKVDFSFFTHTNQIREIVAERAVSIKQDTRSAHGEKAVYTATNGIVELTGHPTAEMPLGRITHASALIWDQIHHTLKARAAGTNVIGEAEAPGKGTNRFSPILPKMK